MTVIGFQTKGVSGAWITKYEIYFEDDIQQYNELGSSKWDGNTDDTTLVTKYVYIPTGTEEVVLVVREIGGANVNEFEMEWEILVCAK